MALQGPAGRPRTIVMAPPVLLLLLALAGTGSPGFWLNNGLCQWPVNTLTVGTVTYDKAQMVRIMDLATGSLPNEYKPAQSLLKLAYQLIPAMLGQANYAQGDCQLPSYIATNITAGVALVGDRLIPPFGDGLCPCCGGSTSTTTCPSTSPLAPTSAQPQSATAAKALSAASSKAVATTSSQPIPSAAKPLAATAAKALSAASS
ncbi:hypothetical protein ABPG75_000355 [Micractinium tetrahymenae]